MPSYSMRPVWYLLVIVAVVGVYLVRRSGQQRNEKEFEA